MFGRHGWLIAAVVAGSVGCGGGGGPPDGAAGDGSEPGDGGARCPEEAARCAARDLLCGVHEDEVCGAIDCGRCRFAAVRLGGPGDLALDAEGRPHVAWLESGAIRYAPIVDGALGTAEQVSPAGSRADAAPRLDIAPSGEPHVVWTEGAAVRHASREAGTWTDRTVGDGSQPAVAVDATGRPHVVYLGTAAAGGATPALHARLEADAFVSARVSDSSFQEPELAGRDSIHLALGGLDALEVYRLEGDVFVAHPFVGVGGAVGPPRDLDLDVGPSGPVVALLDGTELTVHRLEGGGTWSSDVRASDRAGFEREVALGVGPSEGVHLAFRGETTNALVLAPPVGAGTVVAQSCPAGPRRLRIDARHRPHLLHHCDVSATYLTPVGRYSDSYVESCAVVTATVCERACACGGADGRSCCYSFGGGGAGCTFGPGSARLELCLERVAQRICGDPTAPEEPIAACRAAIEEGAPACDAEAATPVPIACEAS